MFGNLKAVAAGGVCLLLGLLLGASGAIVYSDWVSVPAAREAGAEAERATWEKREADAKAKADADRRATQNRIAGIEADYHAREASRTAEVAELNAALDAALKEDADAPSPTPGGACRPVIRRGVSERLNGIGRTGARPPAASPDALVR